MFHSLKTPSFFTSPTQHPVMEVSKKKFQVYLINWEPNNDLANYPAWFLVQIIAGRHYLHASLVIAEVGENPLEFAVTPEGYICIENSPNSHYLSFPDGNKISAYAKEGTIKRKRLCEVLRLPDLSSAEIESYRDHIFPHYNYSGVFWNLTEFHEKGKNENELSSYLSKNLKAARKKEFKEAVKTGRTLSYLNQEFSLALTQQQLKEYREYIHYRAQYRLRINNCSTAVGRALICLYASQQNWSPHFSHRFAKEVQSWRYRGSDLMRTLRKVFGEKETTLFEIRKKEGKWELEEIKKLKPKGFRPYLILGTLVLWLLGLAYLGT